MKFFSYASQEVLISEPGKKIIPKKDFLHILKATEIVKKAQEDALAHIEQTKQDCEAKLQAAKEEGLRQGLESFNMHILALEQEAKRMYIEMQKTLLPLAIQAARKIVNKELETHPETIIDIVSRTIAPAKQNKKVKIYVNKQDLRVLEEKKNKLKNILENVQMLSIAEREDITPGGCIIETESGIINATIENQWKALEAAFTKKKQ